MSRVVGGSREEAGILHLRRRLAAPRDRVFAAFADAARLSQWLGPQGFECVVHEHDARVGGRYRLEMRSPGGCVYALCGEFREVEPYERLSFTWVRGGSGALAGLQTLVALELLQHGSETELVLTQRLIEPEQVRGWPQPRALALGAQGRPRERFIEL